MGPTLSEKLARERRLRLGAQRLLEYKERELLAANQRLAMHSRALSDQIIEQRQMVQSAISEAEQLKGQNSRFLRDLERAHTMAVMAERRMWDSVETVRDGFALFDVDMVMVAANRAFLSIFKGFDEVRAGIAYPEILRICAEESLVDIEDALPEDWVAGMLARIDNDPVEPRELRFFPDRWLRFVERRARDGDLVCVVHDITDTIRREAQLREAQQRAEAANRAKSSFLANMSHEIRTPMNGVVGMADLLCETDLNEDQRLYAETIRASGDALLTIINDVLDYSRIEAEKLVLHAEPFDLERSIHEVVMLLLPKARDKGLDLLIDYDVFLPTRFVADAGRLRQVLTNLVGNAVKFTEKGHVLIRVVGMEADEAPGTWQIHINVEDTGIGIAPENLDLVFGQFAQVEDQQTRRFEGTGLGLAITRQLITLMEGDIWVDSTLGEGSSFGFRLTLPTPEPRADPLTARGKLRQALVVDDHLTNRTILDRQLSAYGLQVQTCRSGEEALELLDTGAEVDILVTDHQMPGMNGIELARRLRARGLEIPIVVLSSNPAAARSETTQGLVSVVLAKPVLRSELFRRLRALSGADDIPPRDRAATRVSAPQATPTRAMRILAAEDNRTNQVVFGKMVKDLDVELIFADNGREAVERFQTFRPDVIFMDISMPEMDGREATRAIRAIEAANGGGRVPVVAMTAHAMAHDEDEILAAGLDHYLTKPLRKAAIWDRISALQPAGVRPVKPD